MAREVPDCRQMGASVHESKTKIISVYRINYINDVKKYTI